jgi:4-amino-4-deoxy-L-arabinose transferase-like glycosyltransferase
MSEPEAKDSPFAPYTAKATATERWIIILLLLLAAFLRLHRLADVPPGIHDDEVIDAEIAESLLAGEPPSVFYTAGEGREGLHYVVLAASRLLVARGPYWYRLPSVLWSLLTMLIVYRLSRRMFGPTAALVAAGGLAVAYWPVYLGRVTLYCVSLPPIAAGMALAIWRGLERPSDDRRAIGWFILAGLLLGLAQYTYLPARVLPLFILPFIAYLALFHRGTLRAHWRGLTLLLVVGAIVSTPMALYLSQHWEQQERITRLSEPLEALMRGDPQPVLSSTVATLGMFIWQGDPQALYNLPGRPVFEPVGSALFIGGVLIALLGVRCPANALCLLWTAVLLTPGMLSHPAPHFVRTIGATVTAFIFPGLAVRWIAERVKSPISLSVALGLLLAFNVALTFRDYFFRWPETSEVNTYHHAGLAKVARYLDSNPETTPVAICTPFLNEEHYFWRTDRQILPYLLNRCDLEITWYSCLESQVFLQGGKTGRYLLANDRHIASFVPPELVERAETVTYLNSDRLVRLEIADQLKGWLAEFSLPTVSPPVFGQTMKFLGYREIESSNPIPGGRLRIITAWQVLATPPKDLSIFVHAFDGKDELVTQGDALAALSDTLRPEDIFVQRHDLPLPEDMQPGDYELRIGLYVRGGNRLLMDAEAGDTLVLGTVEVCGDAICDGDD